MPQSSAVLAQSEQPAPAAQEATIGSAVVPDHPASLEVARQLYASADYGSALDMLNRLLAAQPSPQDHGAIDLYRVFCFVALGQAGEADEAMTAMIARDPLYRPEDSDIPPRLRPAFSAKRALVLPSIAQSRYENAKLAFERSDYKAAAQGFGDALMVLADPDIARQASQPPLSDLRALIDGFNELAVRALTPEPSPPPESTTAPPEVPSVVAVRVPTIYDSNHADVVPPITLKQDMPRFSRPVLVARTGVLFIVINEVGSVESAIITEPLDRAYDQMLLAEVKTWSYRPATRNGVAVKYRKRIQVTLPRQAN